MDTGNKNSHLDEAQADKATWPGCVMFRKRQAARAF